MRIADNLSHPASAEWEGTQGVLFDLDGTLLDTARDMASALNTLRTEKGFGVLPFAPIRELVSCGAGRLVAFAFPSATAEELDCLRDRFIEIYRGCLVVETRAYEGLLGALTELESASIPWGVVTNKPTSLSQPLLEQLGLASRAAVLVSGDTLAERKPHPAPLQYAARICGVAPARCMYVGDAERDIIAARAAGMKSFVALYGYIPGSEQPRSWPANGWLESPLALARLLRSLAGSLSRMHTRRRERHDHT